MRNNLFLLALILLVSCRNKENKAYESNTENETSTHKFAIAFGSCAHETDPQPILNKVVAASPDIFIFLGDNIYGDTHDMDTLKRKYDILGAKPEFQNLLANMPVYAIWDDHDFGWDDAGRHYPYKEESQAIFNNFWQVSATSRRRTGSGIYESHLFGEETERIQLILLDTRMFRDDLVPYKGFSEGDSTYNYQMDYEPNPLADSTFLGREQWQWLETQLKIPAKLRVIASSTQFGITHNGYEAWANVPHEQQKMLNLIKSTQANGVIFISGDVHYAEMSKLAEAAMYPIFDITSSGITSTWDFAAPNDNRIEGPVMENNFGMITVEWSGENPEILIDIIDVEGNKRVSRKISLAELQF